MILSFFDNNLTFCTRYSRFFFLFLHPSSGPAISPRSLVPFMVEQNSENEIWGSSVHTAPGASLFPDSSSEELGNIYACVFASVCVYTSVSIENHEFTLIPLMLIQHRVHSSFPLSIYVHPTSLRETDLLLIILNVCMNWHSLEIIYVIFTPDSWQSS